MKLDYKKYYDELVYIHYWLYKWPDRDHVISFLQGYFLGNEKNILEGRIRIYLNFEYNIDYKFITFHEGLIHYSYLKNSDLLLAVAKILHEMNEKKDIIPIEPPKLYVNTSVLKLSIESVDLKNVVLKSGRAIGIGDSLTLCDLLGDAYRTTKEFDNTIPNPSYEIYFPSEKDFKYVSFYTLNEGIGEVNVFGRVWRIFSNRTQQIKLIKQNVDGCIIVYTELFRVEIEKALEAEELIIDTVLQENFDLSYLKQDLEKYLGGWLEGPINEVIANWCSFTPVNLKPIWWNYARSMNGIRHKIKKNWI